MLHEIESRAVRHRELGPSYAVDSVVVGSGITGLLLAKKLVDLGQRVIVVDENKNLAYGASIKNHGWLHRGTVHAISVQDREQARKITQKIIYGHEFIRSYASECIEDPFDPVYICTSDEDLADKAVDLWDEFGVFHEEISKSNFHEIDSEINRNHPLYFFKSADLRINNRILFQKLLSDIKSKNGIVLKGTQYSYEEDDKIRIERPDDSIGIRASSFIYCTGARIGESYQRLTGSNANVSYWKSHLLFLPKLNPHSLVSLDLGGPIIINHQEISVVNRGYDEVECLRPNYAVDIEQVNLTMKSLSQFYPGLEKSNSEAQYIACIKPSLQGLGLERHSIDSNILEPVSGHFFVLPGKMTEAPFVVDELIHRLYDRLDMSDISQRPLDEFNSITTPKGTVAYRTA